MGKSLTYQEIKDYINSEETGNGCKLITTEQGFEEEKIKQSQNNSKVKLKIKCSCKNEFYKSFDNFKKSKKQCNICSGLYRETYDGVKYYIEVESNSKCKLLSTKYVNNSSRLKIQCECGNIFQTTFAKFKDRNKQQCNDCTNIKMNKIQRRPYNEVKNIIENISDSECKLLSEEKDYKNVYSILDIKCKCGNYFKTSLKLFMRFKQQCDICGEKIRRESLSLPYGVVKSFINDNQNNACELLTEEQDYENSRTLLEIKCKCGETFFTPYHTFNRIIGAKNKCDKCSKEQKIKYNLKKYGVEYPMQNKEVQLKAHLSMFKNDTAPCSSQQRYVYNIIGGELNYPYYNVSLDIAFPLEKTYLECDFSGHWLSITLGDLTEKEFKIKQMNRWYSLMRSGWKEIRIISLKDKLPSDSILLEIIEYACNYLNQGHHYIKFDIDNLKVINSQGEFDYNFGQLRKIKKEDLEQFKEAN